MTETAQTYVGRAAVWRKETYNHGTTPKVMWIVKYMREGGEIVTVRECKTRKEAMQWALTYKD